MAFENSFKSASKFFIIMKTPFPLSRKRMSLKISSALGGMKIGPQIAPESIPWPINPKWAGS